MEGIDLSAALSGLFAPPPIITASTEQLRSVLAQIEATENAVGADIVNFGSGTVSARVRVGESVVTATQSEESERTFDIYGEGYTGDDAVERAAEANAEFVREFESLNPAA